LGFREGGRLKFGSGRFFYWAFGLQVSGQGLYAGGGGKDRGKGKEVRGKGRIWFAARTNLYSALRARAVACTCAESGLRQAVALHLRHVPVFPAAPGAVSPHEGERVFPALRGNTNLSAVLTLSPPQGKEKFPRPGAGEGKNPPLKGGMPKAGGKIDG